MTALPITIDGGIATVTFDRFGLDNYDLFLRAKQLPESQVDYDWESDTYQLTTPARFAERLGAEAVALQYDRPSTAAHLFDYQSWALDLAIEAQRFAAWLDTGLGKTHLYLEWARQVQALTGGRVLILAPPQVIPQVIEMAAEYYGHGLPLMQLHSRDDLDAWCRGAGTVNIALTNYEKFIPGTLSRLRNLAGLVADESGILKTGGGKIKWNLIKSARGIQYKLSCTATPAPNEAMEYASQAAFLEKLRSEGDILWTYFVRDRHGTWSVKPHAREAFYAFMASWSLYMRDPARFGFADILKDLPEPETIEERIPLTDHQRRLLDELLTKNNLGLWADDRVGITVRQKLLQIARGFRYVGTGKDRTVERVASEKPDYVASTALAEVAAGHRVLVWATFDEEGEIVAERLAGKVEAAVLHGRLKMDERLRILKAFRAGEIEVLISKPQLIGYGLNLQFVTSMIFSGFDDSFERMYQAVRRAVRYGQTRRVRVFVPYVPELEGLVFENVREKEQRFLTDVAAQETAYRRALGLGA